MAFPALVPGVFGYQSEILHGGLTELIGINEQVDPNEYGEDVAVALGETYSGEIKSVKLVSYETGTGAVQVPAVRLFIFASDPVIAVGAVAMSLAARRTLVGQVDVLATDWLADANGASAFKAVSLIFHPLSTLYFALQNLGPAAFNDAAGDDEAVQLDFWYRRDS